uniref:Glu-AdT subunit C n=1 Tax=Panagrolaimus sp. JU765 TaxID=591449 RepID=A0AC34QEJ4_9BILA
MFGATFISRSLIKANVQILRQCAFIKIASPKNPKVKRVQVPSNLDELPLSKEMLTKLEQLSALRFQSVEEIESVEEDIRLAQKVFEVDTTGVEPLYSVVEEVINCPLRDDDEIEETSAKNALQNAPVVSEDFLVTPPANIPQSENPLLQSRKSQMSENLKTETVFG